MERPTGS
jgi:hypothetical protein